MKTRVRARIVGRVQGVGFRPTVYRYATELGLGGFVRNDPQGVTLEVEGEDREVGAFFDHLTAAPPRQAVIESVQTQLLGAKGYDRFAVVESDAGGAAAVHISPDLATCPDCLRELLDPRDRRAGYPFLNCTNCGPRFTIIRDLPYDRANTAMAGFTMCRPCHEEFHDPRDRRFHAQPDACGECGPGLRFAEGRGKREEGNDGRPVVGRSAGSGDPRTTEAEEGNDAEAIRRAAVVLRDGGILAVKGLGGYHLACDATNAAAVARLRERKHRPHKPLAVMFRDLETLRQFCEVSEAEEAELLSVARPIVILRQRSDGVVECWSGGNDSPKPNTPILPHSITPDAASVGALLPYTPLHHLLLRDFAALVMTSGNRTEEPIISDEADLPVLLGPIADAALTHNRPIAHKCDDSVLRVVNGQRQFVRRARGFVPNPIRLASDSAPLLAVGGELKSTFCLVRDGWAFLSQHIGDLQEYQTWEYFTCEVAEWQRLMRVAPVAIAHDLHPDYRSTRWAGERAGRNGVLECWSDGNCKGLRPNTPLLHHSNTPLLIPVQHHHAHIASVMGEQGLHQPVIGVALDGTGYGPDGTIWGGEFLVADRVGFERVAHFKQYRLPGGEKAIQEPWRMAVSVLAWEGEPPGEPFALGSAALRQAQGPERSRGRASPSPDQMTAVRQLVETGFNSPLTSSAGRLFDAVAALLGLGAVVSYEAQAAIRLEAAADPQVTTAYEFAVEADRAPWVVNFGPALAALLEEQRGGVPVGPIAARFHNTVAAAIGAVCERVRRERGLDTVALSGGVFQNELLLRRTVADLRARNFVVYTNVLVPPNDGGLALGQAVVAAARLGTTGDLRSGGVRGQETLAQPVAAARTTEGRSPCA